MAKVLFAGDYCPTKSNFEELSHKSAEECIGKGLTDLFSKQDLSVINLETTLTNHKTPKKKRGQINTSDPDTCHFLKEIGISLCCMANNHTIDNGNAGLDNTFQTLKKWGISWIGAGKTTSEAKRPFTMSFQQDGSQLTIYNCANFEFNNIHEGEYGANIYDPLETFDDIRNLKKDNALLVVVYHGGVEYYQYPSPLLQRICRKMIDCGADFVLCQHSHCIGAYEHYNSGFIMYGQGNFLFDDTDNALEKNGVLIQIETITKDIKIIPVRKEQTLVRICSEEDQIRILEEIDERSSEIQQEGRIAQLFGIFSQSQRHEILNSLAGYYSPYKALNKLTNNQFAKTVYTPKALMRLYNIINSPALFEVLNEEVSHYE